MGQTHAAVQGEQLNALQIADVLANSNRGLCGDLIVGFKKKKKTKVCIKCQNLTEERTTACPHTTHSLIEKIRTELENKSPCVTGQSNI